MRSSNNIYYTSWVILIGVVIKLKELLPKSMFIVNEIADMPPPPAITGPHTHHAEFKPFQSNVDFSKLSSPAALIDRVVAIVKKFENSQGNPSGGYDKEKGRWFPHRSLEGGLPTIAYGHKLHKADEYTDGLTEHEAIALLKKDVEEKLGLARRKIHNFDSLPNSAKVAVIDSFFRGDIGPKTIALINKNDLTSAAKEYLNHSEYRHTVNSGVKKRMELNAALMVGKVV